MISRYEYQFMNLAMQIIKTGYVEKNQRTGIGVRRMSHGILQCDLNEEFPILTSKKCYWKSAIEEILWIYRDQSNNIKDLRPKIWDKWADEDGSIGKAYGYQVKEFSQVDYVLNNLHKDHSTRRALFNLWNFADLDEMNLTPCVYTSVWDIVEDKLNVLVTSRSCDLLVGGVFNVIQYAALCHMFARELGVKPGCITFVAADVHIYEDQIDGFSKWMQNYRNELACGRYQLVHDNTAKIVANKVQKELEEAGNPEKGSEKYQEILNSHEEELANLIKENKEGVLKNISEEYREETNVMLANSTAFIINDYNQKNGTEITEDNIPEELQTIINQENEKIESGMKGLLEQALACLTDPVYIDAYNSKPRLVLNPEKKAFKDFVIEDFELECYHSLEKIDLPVAK